MRFDDQGAPLDGEAALRAETARAVACEWAARPRDDEAIARYTELYLRQSGTPACELMVIDARSNIRIARARGAGARSGDAQAERWRRAWEVLSAVSMAWAQAPASLAQGPTLERCVRPARDTLSQFPALTVTVEPSDAEGYRLYWDGSPREGSLPHIMPGAHALDLVPPPGYAATLSIDEVPVIRRYEGVVHRDIELRWAQRMRITIRFEPVPPMEGAASELSREREDESSPALLWGGAAAVALGVAGITLSALRAASFEDRADRLYEQGQCPQGRDCAGEEIRAAWSAADDWRWWGYPISGAVAVAGIAGIVTHFVLEAGAEPGQVARVRPRVELGRHHVGAWLGVSF